MNSNSFKEVASNAGINWSRQKGKEAFRVDWLDYNHDGFLDLWISGHGYNGSSTQYQEGKFPYLYLNNGDGTFTNLFDSDSIQGEGGGVHGTTWIDFNNDPEQDFLAAGGEKLGDTSNVKLDLLTNKLFVNRNNLHDEAGIRGIENAIARSRFSVWFDGNNDDLLDAVVVTALRDDDQGYTAYFEQQSDGTFIDKTSDVGLDINESDPTLAQSAVAVDFDNDMDLDIYIANAYSSFNQTNILYENDGNGNFNKVELAVGAESRKVAHHRLDFEVGQRLAMADYDNDGFLDIFASSTITKSLRKTYFDNTLSGTDESDAIIGLDGNDTINGNNRKDSLEGGDANDTIDQSNSNDLLLGEVGDDCFDSRASKDLPVSYIYGVKEKNPYLISKLDSDDYRNSIEFLDRMFLL